MSRPSCTIWVMIIGQGNDGSRIWVDKPVLQSPWTRASSSDRNGNGPNIWHVNHDVKQVKFYCWRAQVFHWTGELELGWKRYHVKCGQCQSRSHWPTTLSISSWIRRWMSGFAAVYNMAHMIVCAEVSVPAARVLLYIILTTIHILLHITLTTTHVLLCITLTTTHVLLYNTFTTAHVLLFCYTYNNTRKTVHYTYNNTRQTVNYTYNNTCVFVYHTYNNTRTLY